MRFLVFCKYWAWTHVKSFWTASKETEGALHSTSFLFENISVVKCTAAYADWNRRLTPFIPVNLLLLAYIRVFFLEITAMIHICNTTQCIDILVCQNVCIEKYWFRFTMTRTCSHISFLFASHSVVSRVVCIIIFLKTDIPNVEDIFDLLSRETCTLRRSLPRFCEFSSTTLIRIKCRLDTYLTLTFSVNGFQT